MFKGPVPGEGGTPAVGSYLGVVIPAPLVQFVNEAHT